MKSAIETKKSLLNINVSLKQTASDSSSSGSQETKHLEEAVKAGHGDAQQPQLLFRSPSLCLLQ